MDWTRDFTGVRPPRRTALVIIAAISTSFSVLLLSSLAPDSSALGQNPAAISGTVSVQGGKPARDVSIAVARISDDVEAETVARGLEVPWALAFTPDGRILVTERLGRIRVIQGSQLLDEPFAMLDVAHVSEAGLMGIAVDVPDRTTLSRRTGHVDVPPTPRQAAVGSFDSSTRTSLLAKPGIFR